MTNKDNPFLQDFSKKNTFFKLSKKKIIIGLTMLFIIVMLLPSQNKIGDNIVGSKSLSYIDESKPLIVNLAGKLIGKNIPINYSSKKIENQDTIASSDNIQLVPFEFIVKFKPSAKGKFNIQGKSSNPLTLGRTYGVSELNQIQFPKIFQSIKVENIHKLAISGSYSDKLVSDSIKKNKFNKTEISEQLNLLSQQNEQLKITKEQGESVPSLNELFVVKVDISNFKNYYKIKDIGDMNSVNKSLKLKDNEFAKNILDQISKDPDIDYVYPNFVVEMDVIPDDEYFNDYMWNLKNIKAPEAWNTTTGSNTVVTAVIDSGVDYTHPDLVKNMWINWAEVGKPIAQIQDINTNGVIDCQDLFDPVNNISDGIDSDNNGYIDDFCGWNFSENNNDISDYFGHGTHIAGTIAAVGNNSIGIPGINWTSKIMSLRFFPAGTWAAAISALAYASNMGARVANMSFGSVWPTLTNGSLEEGLRYAHDSGVVLVAAAGNHGHRDAYFYIPSSSRYVLTVGAVDSTDTIATFTNLGDKIDVVAPGVNVLSLRGKNTDMYGGGTHIFHDIYYYSSGTSMATPHVAGAAALLLGYNLNLTNEQVRQYIRYGADDLGPQGRDTDYGYGRLNLRNSLDLLISQPNILTGFLTSPDTFTRYSSDPVDVDIKGGIVGSNFSKFVIETGNFPTLENLHPTWNEIYTSQNQILNGLLATVNSIKFSDGNVLLKLTTYNTFGQQSESYIPIYVSQIVSHLNKKSLLLPKTSSANIIGAAYTFNSSSFDHYKIEWGEGANPTSFSGSGITLVNGGTTPVSNGILGTWNNVNLSNENKYTLKLTTFSKGVEKESLSTFNLDENLMNGFPKEIGFDPKYDENDVLLNYFGQMGPQIPSNIAAMMGDINKDGYSEMVFEDRTGLYAYDYQGNILSGFPRTDIKQSFSSNSLRGTMHNDVALADLNNDGKDEIVASCAVLWPQETWEWCNKLFVIDGNGHNLTGWPKSYGSAGDTVYEPISARFADFDNDERLEIAVGHGTSAIGMVLSVYKLDGTLVPGFEKNISSSFSLEDLNKDGNIEVVTIMPMNSGDPYIPNYDNGIFVWDSNGNLLSGWPQPMPRLQGWRDSYHVPSYGPPTITNLDNDEKLEIVAEGYYMFPNWVFPVEADTELYTYAFKIDGTKVVGYPIYKLVHQYVNNTPTIGFISAGGTSTIDNLYDYQHYYNQPALIDYDGDGNIDIAGINITLDRNLLPVGNRYLEVTKQDQTVLWQSKVTFDGIVNTPIVRDIDHDGKLEAAFVANETVYLWKFPNSDSNKNMFWTTRWGDKGATSRQIEIIIPPSTSSSSTISSTSISSISTSSLISSSSISSVSNSSISSSISSSSSSAGDLVDLVIPTIMPYYNSSEQLIKLEPQLCNISSMSLKAGTYVRVKFHNLNPDLGNRIMTKTYNLSSDLAAYSCIYLLPAFTCTSLGMDSCLDHQSILLELDPANEISESNENNNFYRFLESSWDPWNNKPADLIVSNISYSSYDNIYTALLCNIGGGRVPYNFELKVENLSNGFIKNVLVYNQYTVVAQPIYGCVVALLGTCSINEVNCTTHPLLRVTIDSVSEIDESNKNNNIFTSRL